VSHWLPNFIINTFCQIKNKTIPTFEKAHGASYQALIMVGNSQSHSAYSEDALVILWMNVKPTGMQAHMHDSWFMQDSQKVFQPMNYLAGLF